MNSGSADGWLTSSCSIIYITYSIMLYALQRGSSSLDGRHVSLSSSNGLVHNNNSSRDDGERIHSLASGDKSILIRGGEVISQPQRRKLVVMLVATALFNDMLQLTMLLPITYSW